jgi:hypothetical protein
MNPAFLLKRMGISIEDNKGNKGRKSPSFTLFASVPRFSFRRARAVFRLRFYYSSSG